MADAQAEWQLSLAEQRIAQLKSQRTHQIRVPSEKVITDGDDMRDTEHLPDVASLVDAEQQEVRPPFHISSSPRFVF